MIYSLFINHVHLLPAAVREDATPDAFRRLADESEVAGAVCFAPFSGFLKGLDLHHNRWLAEELKAHPRFVPFGTLDPGLPAKDQIRELLDLGFKGVKLHPSAQDFHLFGDWAREVYALMEEHRLIAVFHTGIHGRRLTITADPLLYDEIASHYPALPMVFEHVGGWHFFRPMLGVIANNRNRGNCRYAGITSVLDAEHQRHWYMGKEGLDQCRWQAGPDLMIYGLDFPYNQQPQLERDLYLIRSLNWPHEDIRKLLGGNLRRLLGVEKGTPASVGGDPWPTGNRKSAI